MESLQEEGCTRDGFRLADGFYGSVLDLWKVKESGCPSPGSFCLWGDRGLRSPGLVVVCNLIACKGASVCGAVYGALCSGG